MRGMIKWKPFNTLLNNKDINEIIKTRNLVQKPIIAEDRIIEINNDLNEALNNNKTLKIKYFNEGELKTTTGNIQNINTKEKYILVNNIRIYFKNLIKTDIIN